ncbi:hypothetical protein [Pedobacter aquatilis]|uniref:hypothetical protein n=1 Tax=Pedobacter aquatilis TaxID=351343 RepID=UPI00292D6E44|nr:hypothetical protein [Pedobacter aquatilis]
MASTSEVGFAKQLADFEDFTELLAKLGDAFVPPKRELNLNNLQTQLAAAKDVMREVSRTAPIYSVAVDNQALAFKNLNDKITRSLNYYKICISNPAQIDTAKNLADKIRGMVKSTKAPLDSETSAVKKVSQSQMSYDSRIENMRQYIDVLVLSGEYINPGSGIDIDDLNQLLIGMEKTNSDVARLKFPLDEARNKRALIFYAPDTGLADLIIKVKRYLKATLPKDHTLYPQLSKYTIRKRV